MGRSDSTHGSYDGLVSVRCHRRKLSNVRWYGQLDKSQPRLVLFSTLGKQFCHEHFWILKMIRYTNKGQHIYRPQRSCEGYVFTGVCLSTWGGGVPDQVHPPGTRYTPQTRYTPLGPGTPPRDQVHPPGTRYTPPDQMHPRDTATAADGTHPTGMHSCFTCDLREAQAEFCASLARDFFFLR